MFVKEFHVLTINKKIMVSRSERNYTLILSCPASVGLSNAHSLQVGGAVGALEFNQLTQPQQHIRRFMIA